MCSRAHTQAHTLQSHAQWIRHTSPARTRTHTHTHTHTQLMHNPAAPGGTSSPLTSKASLAHFLSQHAEQLHVRRFIQLQSAPDLLCSPRYPPISPGRADSSSPVCRQHSQRHPQGRGGHCQGQQQVGGIRTRTQGPAVFLTNEQQRRRRTRQGVGHGQQAGAWLAAARLKVCGSQAAGGGDSGEVAGKSAGSLAWLGRQARPTSTFSPPQPPPLHTS